MSEHTYGSDRGSVGPSRKLPRVSTSFPFQEDPFNHGYNASRQLVVSMHHNRPLRSLDELYPTTLGSKSPCHHSNQVFITLLHIWFISLAYGFSCMMHNLSKMMVIGDSAGDAS